MKVTKLYDSVIIVASFEKVCGIGSKSRETLWKNRLEGGGYNLPSHILDSSALDIVLVGCGKQIYKINIYSGLTIWQQKLSKNLFGTSFVTMATH
jgi:hypothetical protein